MKKVKKYLPGAEALAGATGATGGGFANKAGAFMGNYGGAITSAASSLMPLLMKKPDPNAKPYKKGSKLIKYQEGTDNAVAGPSRKETADLMRKYNEANKNNPNIIGAIDDEEFNAREQQLQDLGVSTPIRKSTPPSLLTPKQVSFKLPQQSLPTPKLNKVAIDKPSRRERKAENKRLETLARAPITYTEPAFVGPSDEELKTGKAKQDAEAKQNKQLKDSFQSDVLRKTIPKSKTVSTEKNPILYKEAKEKNPYISFKQMSVADQKLYRAGMATGKAFKVGGREYAAAKPEEIAFSARMASKGNKPDTYYKDVYESRKPTLGKNFGTTKTPFVGARENANNPIKGQELVRMSRMGKANQDNFYTPGRLPIPIKRNYSSTTKTTSKSNVEQPSNTSNKTARHTTEDPGKKMKNKLISFNEDKNYDKLQERREVIKKRKEQEQVALREQTIKMDEKMKKENPERYKLLMKINAKREAKK
jgi:hypothetical protein